MTCRTTTTWLGRRRQQQLALGTALIAALPCPLTDASIPLQPMPLPLQGAIHVGGDARVAREPDVRHLPLARSRHLRLRGGSAADLIHGMEPEQLAADRSLVAAGSGPEDVTEEDEAGLREIRAALQAEAAKQEEDEQWSSGMGNPGSDTVWVPDNFTSIPRAIRKCCGIMMRIFAWPEPDPESGLVEPPIDQYGEPVVEEWHEWEHGTGQKLRLRAGFYTWGAWSERKKRFKYPNVIIVNSPLDMLGVEDGVCLNGGWTFLNGTGSLRNLSLINTHDFVPGKGGGMLCHIEGGNWTFQRCRLNIRPGPLTCVLAVAGTARVAVDEAIIARTHGAEIGAQGYGMFVWCNASVVLTRCFLSELKVAADVSYSSQLRMDQCNVSSCRIGLLMHDDCHVYVRDTVFLLTHRAAFEVGMHGRDRAHLRLDNVALRGSRQWIDEWRPKTLAEANVTTCNDALPLPTKHEGTNFPIMGVPQTHQANTERLVRDLHRYCPLSPRTRAKGLHPKNVCVVLTLQTAAPPLVGSGGA